MNRLFPITADGTRDNYFLEHAGVKMMMQCYAFIHEFIWMHMVGLAFFDATIASTPQIRKPRDDSSCIELSISSILQ